MALWEVVIAWVLVAVLFLLWEFVAVRIDRSGNAGGWLRAPAQVYIVEALLLTLLGTLWFASLGSGMWPLVFALLGLLMEWPGALRYGERSRAPVETAARRLLTGVLRILAAGAILWWWVG